MICVGDDGPLLVESACKTVCHDDPISEGHHSDEAAPDSHEACGGCTDHLLSEMVGVNRGGSRVLVHLTLNPQDILVSVPVHPVVYTEIESGLRLTNAPPSALPPPAQGLTTTVLIC